MASFETTIRNVSRFGWLPTHYPTCGKAPNGRPVDARAEVGIDRCMDPVHDDQCQDFPRIESITRTHGTSLGIEYRVMALLPSGPPLIECAGVALASRFRQAVKRRPGHDRPGYCRTVSLTLARAPQGHRRLAYLLASPTGRSQSRSVSVPTSP